MSISMRNSRVVRGMSQTFCIVSLLVICWAVSAQKETRGGRTRTDDLGVMNPREVPALTLPSASSQ
jgi:hypothetical protein